MIKLPLAELKVMNIIWENDEDSISSKEVIDKLSGTETWKRTTILTLLSRLIEKKFLSGRKIGRHTFYTKLISKNDYADFATREFMKNIHGNSIESLISSLRNDDDISECDLLEINNL